MRIVKQLFSGIKKSTRSIYPPEITKEERDIIEKCRSFTMTSNERIWATISSTKYIIRNEIPGAFVECGVWRGGSAMAMASTILSLGAEKRQFFLFDTYEGMSAPSNLDRDASGYSASSLLNEAAREEGNNIWCVASLDDVKANFAKTSYPDAYVRFIAGDVNGTLEVEANLPSEIALLRLDTDWYESTKKELEILFPRLVTGGVCLIDDYGHWQGARKAVDEYFEKNNIFPLMHVTDYTGRAFIKI